ncbi:hypothetical protein ABEF95_010089 [Exophiala dermatitidis]
MSLFQGGHGHAGANNAAQGRISRKPTGLRSRNIIPQTAPRFPTTAVSSSLCTATVNSPPDFNFRGQPSPLNPTSSAPRTRKKSWISSASQHLRLRKSRERMDSTKHSITSATTLASPEPASTRDFTGQAHTFSASRPPNSDRRNRPLPRPSPTDKPLPSLPVAAVKVGSPVRRSLIDCSERPLRRSISPSGGQGWEHDHWPTMAPVKPSPGPAAPPRAGSVVKPSLGESIIEGMRGLNIEDAKEGDSHHPPKFHFSNSAAKSGKASNKASNSKALLDVPNHTSDRPLSSSQLPKPRDSMLQSLARHVDAPSVRQTKTSAMRLRRSIGKTAWGSAEKKQEKDGHLRPIQEKGQSQSMARARQLSPGGPFRSQSRGRYAVTARGSPYTIPSRLTTKSNKAAHDAEDRAEFSPNAAVMPLKDEQLSHGRDPATTGHTVPSKQALRQSSIPLPSRGQPQAKTVDGNDSTDETKRSDEKRHTSVPEHTWADLAPTPATIARHNRHPHETQSKQAPQLLDVKQVLCTPPPHDDESQMGSEGSATVQGSDSLGGFRIRRVRNTPEGGPTLRINDSASRILLGEESQSGTPDMGDLNVTLNQKESVPDLHEPPATKDQSRRASALLTRPLSFARSITERSQGQSKHGDDEESQNLIENDKNDGTDLPAELPGSDLSIREKPSSHSIASVDVTEAAPLDVTEKRGSLCFNHSDWPGKEFADFKISSDCPQQRDGPSPDPSAAEASKPSSSRTSVRSRPSTIVLRQAPTKEISPFLFQDLEQEKASQQKYLRDILDDTKGSESGRASGSDFPPRTSSRKPKPPPIIVSSPERGPPDGQGSARAARAYEVDPTIFPKPKNVKTFSQSISPKTDSSKARKAPHKLSYTPSSSSRKVISNIRGLFHKRSVDSSAGSDITSSGKARLQGSLRRKPAPGGLRLTNPLSSDSSRTTGLNPNDTHYKNATPGGRPVLRNPFISPTTPFTATVRPSPPPTSPSPSNIASPALSSGSATSPTTSPSLSSATSLTHTLLDLARAEADPQRKTALIELSKTMVGVVNAARDAEKAMEKAKMEAARAEVSWLKVQKEVSAVEVSMRGLLERSTPREA